MARRAPEDYHNYNIRFKNDVQKETWSRLSTREVVPSKYPHESTLGALGISENFWSLCDLGDGEGLTRVFQGGWPTYRVYTLEFLSTLKLTKHSRTREIQKVQFRLANHTYKMRVEEFDDIFACHEPEGPFEFDPITAWAAISIKGETHPYASGSAKSTSIRNPVLRYIHRALAQSVFGRGDSGGVNTTELQILWSLLHGRGFNLGRMMLTFFERITHREGSSIECGGIVTAIMDHFGIDAGDWSPVLGERFLSLDVLYSMDFLKFDRNGQGFVLQNEGDNFPVPNPFLTRIEGPVNRVNWKLNSPLHRQVVANTPQAGTFSRKSTQRRTPVFQPEFGSQVDEAHMLPPPPPLEEERPIPHRHSVHGERPSRRRPREQTPTEFQEYVAHRFDVLHDDMVDLRRLSDERNQTLTNRFDAFEAAAVARHNEYMGWHNNYVENQRADREMLTRADTWRGVEQMYWSNQRRSMLEYNALLTQVQSSFDREREERQTMGADVREMLNLFQGMNFGQSSGGQGGDGDQAPPQY